MGGRVVEQSGSVEQRRRIERLVVDEPRGTGLDQARGVRPLVAGRVRVRDDDHRQTQRGHLGQRGSSGPPDDEVGGASAGSISSRRNGYGR